MTAAGMTHVATIFAAETSAARRCTRFRELSSTKGAKALEVYRLKQGLAPC